MSTRVSKMPIYEYTCKVCLSEFEKLQPVNKMEIEQPCPDCGGASARQLSVFTSFVSENGGKMSAIASPVGAGGCCGGACGC